ncbi:hypothetical protein E3N88_04517 [Mikania micrantha]|uniref:Uncharacterized protein n=1 Tax=Mikania micrantha TaxID=192012 RepID=A0A5N6PUN0_9ASTR|nr:hypothetical protein E3N88_04517 [Mikania micrantha]
MINDRLQEAMVDDRCVVKLVQGCGCAIISGDQMITITTRNGSMPLDKEVSCTSQVSYFDSEDNVEEKNLVWVNDKAKETWDKYDGYLVKKYGDECNNHPKFDEDLWSQAAGGKNKGKMYGLSNISDP